MGVESSPAEGLSADSAVLFLALQRRFVAGLSARWTDIRDAPDLPSLQGALHRLRGSAGSYGFAPLGQCASELEALAADGAGPDLAMKLALLDAEIRRIEAQWLHGPDPGAA